MRSKWLLLPLLAAMLVSATGCTIGAAFPRTPVSPPPGYIYDNVHAPLDVNYHGDVEARPGKVGETRASYLCLWILSPALSFGWGDASVETAAADGGLKEVHHVDYERRQILGLYSEFTVRAYGK